MFLVCSELRSLVVVFSDALSQPQISISGRLSLLLQVVALEDHSRQQPARVMDTFLFLRGCPLMGASTAFFIDRSFFPVVSHTFLAHLDILL